MEQYLSLYHKKLIILIGHVNKFNTKMEKPLITDEDVDDVKTGCKTFVTKTIKHISYFSKQSTKVFSSSDYYIYKSIAGIWKELSDTDKALLWDLLFEIFTMAVGVFPVVRATDYNFVNIILTLEKHKTDIPLPDLPALNILSGCVKVTMKRINTELDEKKISGNLVDRISEELQQQEITSINQMNKVKTKFNEILQRDEVKYILDIIKSYFNELVIERLKSDADGVFESQKFKSFTKKYKKSKIMSMIQNSEMTFSYIRQMIIESGIIVLLGKDFECPMSFDECRTLFEKYSGQKFSGTDLKSLIGENSKQLLEIPQVKKFLKNTGYKDMLGPFMNMFEKHDYEKEKNDRKKTRMKKKLNKLMKDDE